MICNLGSRVVNNYLISSDLGYILIDTGYDGSFQKKYEAFFERSERE